MYLTLASLPKLAGQTPLGNVRERFMQANDAYPDSKVHGANMGPIWDRQDRNGPHVDPMNFAIRVFLRV